MMVRISSPVNARRVVVRMLPCRATARSAAASVSSSGASMVATMSWAPSVHQTFGEADAEALEGSLRGVVAVDGVLGVADALVGPIDQCDVGGHGILLSRAMAAPTMSASTTRPSRYS
jgi:hypothetical protein